ncbi:MAG: transcription elongation factor GreB [Moraxellaceae bacterium]|nr:MAG: transcription elongation factor GreB [Moraxellaceae bacterium]
MGRYRPPRPYSSPYITLQGKIKLEDELRYLGYTKRPEVTRALAAAAAEGDRSENAEYIYRKKQLREIDSRLQYLVKRLEKLKCIDKIPDDQSRVFFAAWVDLEDEDGKSITYRLVGPDEFDVSKGWISIDSPVAKALLKKQVGDEVSVVAPNGEIHYEVMGIRYK